MKGSIIEDSFGAPYKWTWTRHTGDAVGLVEYLKSSDAVFRWLDFRKHPDPYSAKCLYNKDRRTYHVDNEHPDPPDGSIPRLSGSFHINRECYVTMSPYIAVSFAGFEDFTLYVEHLTKFDEIIEDLIDKIKPSYFTPVEERNGMHLEMLERRTQYRPQGVAF